MRCARTVVVGTVCLVVLGLGAGSAGAGTNTGSAPKPQKPKIVTGSGDISNAIAEYQALLGTDNGGVPQSFSSGRREINWDAVPDEFSEPNAYPSDFFNAPQAPRARGVVLEHAGRPPRRERRLRQRRRARRSAFGDLNPSYIDTFTAFSEERLFSPVGSNVANLQLLRARHRHEGRGPGLRRRLHRRRQQGRCRLQVLRREGEAARQVRGPEVEERLVVPRRRVPEADRRSRCRSCTATASSDPTTAQSTTSP